MDADVVLLAGGGAEAYQDAAKELFPKSRIVLPNESVASNAGGLLVLRLIDRRSLWLVANGMEKYLI